MRAAFSIGWREGGSIYDNEINPKGKGDGHYSRTTTTPYPHLTMANTWLRFSIGINLPNLICVDQKETNRSIILSRTTAIIGSNQSAWSTGGVQGNERNQQGMERSFYRTVFRTPCKQFWGIGTSERFHLYPLRKPKQRWEIAKDGRQGSGREWKTP